MTRSSLQHKSITLLRMSSWQFLLRMRLWQILLRMSLWQFLLRMRLWQILLRMSLWQILLRMRLWQILLRMSLWQILLRMSLWYRGSTQSWLATLLSFLIARRWVGLQTLWQFRLKDLSFFDGTVGAWCFGCCQAHPGLPAVRFLLLRYSALRTVESLSLLYLLFISWFICSKRWCMDKLGVFNANHTSMCLDPYLN